jgi:peptidoglycan/xylan/chitin deacetylase (PgdA/CDA1 family)
MVNGALGMASRNGSIGRGRCCAMFAIFFISIGAFSSSARAEKDCKKPLYLTFDTGHMEVAPLVADVLKRQQVAVTFFAANERTKVGDGSLGEHWAPWWRARAAEGHEFASHTWNHTYWRADQGTAKHPSFLVRPSAGPREGQDFLLSAAGYCQELDAAADRLKQITGKTPLPLFRAPGGKTSPQLLASAHACGYTHVGWSPTGFLGDELSSERFSNATLLSKALRDIRSGDILLAHLGIWSRKDPWAPAVLEPLIVGLKERGFCFQTLRQHPVYGEQRAR